MTQNPAGAGGRAPASYPEGDWLTPQAATPVRARVKLPGSKSITNRALVLAALADGPAEILRPLEARDTGLMADGLRELGAEITSAGGSWLVRPIADQPGQRHGQTARVDVGNAGTVLRFLPAVAALTSTDTRFTGDARVSARPVGALLGAARAPSRSPCTEPASCPAAR
jgi:3-phosphoshikimate 1-carboxyvinyltransferase